MSRSMRSDRIRLEDVTTLTFFADKQTTHRRKPAVPQLTCQGKACKLYQPDVIQCSNVGGSPPDWACNAELPDFLRMGRVEVSCENWSDSASQTHVLKGSCGLDYRLIDLGSPSRHQRDSSSWSPIPLLAIALGLFILYRWYRAATGPATPNGGPRGPGGGGPPWNPFNRPGDDNDDDPPPPYPKGGATAQRAAPAQQARGPGFLTGLVGGAAGAYAANQLFGGGARTRQEQRYRGYQAADPLVRGRRDDRGEGPSGFGGLGAGGSGSGSGGMRSSTGYGGTRNR